VGILSRAGGGSDRRAALAGPAWRLAEVTFATAVLTRRHAARLRRLTEERDRLAAEAHEASTSAEILESITDAFIAVDRAWRFTYVNRVAERLVRRSRESLLGREVWEEFPEATMGFMPEYQRAMEDRTTVHFEGYYPPLETWFEVQASPAANGLSIYFRDISPRKHAEEQLRESEARYRQLLEDEREAHAEAERRRRQLERVTESRAVLMRGFGHDVKNSLGTALIAVKMLERRRSDGGPSAKARGDTDRIHRSIRGAVKLIDDLLDIARAEAGQLEFECIETDVCALSREVVDDFRLLASAADQALTIRAPEPQHAMVDPARLRQIVANLLSNAVKHATPGPVEVYTDLRSSGGPGDGEWVTVSVSDSGPGIPMEKRELIFEEYVRLDPAASQGSGIGLAISRRIARLMGGDLTVESALGRGSTFTIWLPAHCKRGAP